MATTRTCEFCESEFLARSKTTRFCDIRCQRSARLSRLRMQPDRPCYKCGVIVQRERGMPGRTVCDNCRVNHRREKAREYELARTWRRYNITPERYDEMLRAQNGVCAVCKTDNPNHKTSRRNERWSIDHDHECCPGEFSCGNCVRGLLCARCNTGLGWFNDDPLVLAAAQAYLATAAVS